MPEDASQEQVGGGEPRTVHVRLAVRRTGEARTETLMGREHLVYPAVLVREQVLVNNLGRTFLPYAEIRASVDQWSGMPVVIRHPPGNRSARQPGILNRQGVGWIYQPRASRKALRAEIWLDTERLRDVQGADEVVENVEAGGIPEVSTGFDAAVTMVAGTHDGREYDLVFSQLRPDHLALLPDQTGACSVEDGCGLARNAAGDEVACNCGCGGAHMAEQTDEQGQEGAGQEGGAPPADPNAEAAANTEPVPEAAANQSDEDRRTALRIALQARFGGEDYIWVEAVFSDDGTVVFEQPAGSLRRVSYVEGEGGTYTFSEPEAVRRVTTFEPIADPAATSANADGGDAPAPNGTANEETDMADDNATAQNESETIRILRAELREERRLRAEHEERAANALREEEAERVRLTERIVANSRNPWSEDELDAMSMPQLRKVDLSLGTDRAANYGGRGGPRGDRFDTSFVQDIGSALKERN